MSELESTLDDLVKRYPLRQILEILGAAIEWNKGDLP